ncbi:trehalose synthase [Quadrisphaera setariae]|uniref:Trehalose synthase n=2 Tax=Quadrisphaera setariae TaxID=2593304 RepID=A0A5C8Z5F1_9ACTN|nr:trehalose synthase [Quadrisphaera setariae]
MMLTTTADEWWATAVGYCLDIKRFTDSDGDGRGDLAGLGAHLDHLVDLGVDFLWFQPFYPSPEGDDGYDISDYYGVDDGMGTLGEFVEVVRAARERGMRVIVDLVVNHTSDEHPWFQSARSDPDSPYRHWYVWREEPDPEDADADIIFPDAEDSVWSRDEVAGLYYRHRFYRHQPDLNTSEPEVRDEIRRIMGFWLQLGVAGFRVDAAPFLAETATRDGDADDTGPASTSGSSSGERDEQLDDDTALDESLAMLDVMRTFLSRRSAEAVMLGEVNKPRDEIAPFFGGAGQRMTMCFDFTLNQALYLAMARGDSGPVREAVESRPELTEGKSWGLFVRNHDELTLDQLSDDERQEVFDAFGPEEEVQLFGRGLRLRLPTMVDGDRDRMELAYCLTWSLPGTPVLYYGEEVGQLEDLSIPGRLSVRTPMAWAAGDAGPGPVVAEQERDPDSLLHFFRRMLRAYRGRPELGRGAVRLVDVGEPSVLAHTMTWRGRTVLALHSLRDAPVTVTVPDGVVEPGTELVELLTSSPVTVPDGAFEVELPRFGRVWLGDT